MTLNPELDRYSARQVHNNNVSMETVKSYMVDTLLVDIWRIRNPDKRHYTYRQSRLKVMSRIDYFLIEEGVASWIKEIKIIPGFRTDHSAIVCEILTHNIARGPGTWKLNNRLLTEIEYLQGTVELTNKASLLGQTLTKRELWEMIKIETINYSKQYAKNRAL